MTKFTQKMKQAQSRADKIKVVAELSKDARFVQANDQYIKMKAAK